MFRIYLYPRAILNRCKSFTPVPHLILYAQVPDSLECDDHLTSKCLLIIVRHMLPVKHGEDSIEDWLASAVAAMPSKVLTSFINVTEL